MSCFYLHFRCDPRILELTVDLEAVFSNCVCHPLLSHEISVVSHMQSFLFVCFECNPNYVQMNVIQSSLYAPWFNDIYVCMAVCTYQIEASDVFLTRGYSNKKLEDCCPRKHLVQSNIFISDETVLQGGGGVVNCPI